MNIVTPEPATLASLLVIIVDRNIGIMIPKRNLSPRTVGKIVLESSGSCKCECEQTYLVDDFSEDSYEYYRPAMWGSSSGPTTELSCNCKWKIYYFPTGLVYTPSISVRLFWTTEDGWQKTVETAGFGDNNFHEDEDPTQYRISNTELQFCQKSTECQVLEYDCEPPVKRRYSAAITEQTIYDIIYCLLRKARTQRSGRSWPSGFEITDDGGEIDHVVEISTIADVLTHILFHENYLQRYPNLLLDSNFHTFLNRVATDAENLCYIPKYLNQDKRNLFNRRCIEEPMVQHRSDLDDYIWDQALYREQFYHQIVSYLGMYLPEVRQLDRFVSALRSLFDSYAKRPSRDGYKRFLMDSPVLNTSYSEETNVTTDFIEVLSDLGLSVEQLEDAEVSEPIVTTFPCHVTFTASSLNITPSFFLVVLFLPCWLMMTCNIVQLK